MHDVDSSQITLFSQERVYVIDVHCSLRKRLLVLGVGGGDGVNIGRAVQARDIIYSIGWKEAQRLGPKMRSCWCRTGFAIDSSMALTVTDLER
jgi:Fe2+ transport system protein FeoA